MLIFVVNTCPARTFWNSTHCLVSPFMLDWSRNLWQNPMWNMAVNNISYPIYPLSTRTEKGYITKMIPFFFCSVYVSDFSIDSDFTTIIHRPYQSMLNLRTLTVWKDFANSSTAVPLRCTDTGSKRGTTRIEQLSSNILHVKISGQTLVMFHDDTSVLWSAFKWFYLLTDHMYSTAAKGEVNYCAAPEFMSVKPRVYECGSLVHLSLTSASGIKWV